MGHRRSTMEGALWVNSLPEGGLTRGFQGILRRSARGVIDSRAGRIYGVVSGGTVSLAPYRSARPGGLIITGGRGCGPRLRDAGGRR